MLSVRVMRKRGRPPKEKFTFPGGIIDWGYELQQEIRGKLTVSLAKIPSWNGMGAAQQDALIEGLVDVAGNHLAAVALKKHPTKRRGRKTNFDISVLISDCAEAITKATGKSAAMWANRYDESLTVQDESLAVQLARVILATLGGCSVGAMRRSADGARKITRS